LSPFKSPPLRPSCKFFKEDPFSYFPDYLAPIFPPPHEAKPTHLRPPFSDAPRERPERAVVPLPCPNHCQSFDLPRPPSPICLLSHYYAFPTLKVPYMVAVISTDFRSSGVSPLPEVFEVQECKSERMFMGQKRLPLFPQRSVFFRLFTFLPFVPRSLTNPSPPFLKPPLPPKDHKVFFY